MDRTERDKTAAVHFLRFELGHDDAKAVHGGEAVHIGIDHPELTYETQLAAATVASLAEDLSSPDHVAQRALPHTEGPTKKSAIGA